MTAEERSSIRFLGIGLSICLLGVVGWPASAWAQSSDVCGPPPAVKAALDRLPRQTPDLTDWQYHQQRLSALQTLLRQYPGDLFVHRAYIDMMYGRSDREKVIAEYKARYEQNRGNAQSGYLYANTLVGRQSAEAVKLFDGALQAEPKFPWPHLELATIYNSTAFLNKGQRNLHLRAFLDACPASLDGYELLTRIDDKDFLKPYTAQLRTMLASRSDADAVGAYRTLWSLEFKVHPASEYDALRRQVGQDIERIRQLKIEDKPQYYEALVDGYKLVNDQKQSDWAQERNQTRFPTPYGLPAMTKWYKDHHGPGRDAAPSVKQAYFRDELQQSIQWAKERPNTTFIWEDRLGAMEEPDDVPAADVIATADQVLKVAKDNARPDEPASYIYSDVAETLSQKHLVPERVVGLAQKGLAQWEIESKEPPYDFNDKESLDHFKYNQDNSRLDLLGFEADGYLQLNQADKAQLALTQMDERIEELKSQVGDDQRQKKSYARKLSVYWGLMAREAELRGRKLDAMGFYENALLNRLDAEEKPETGKKDELADHAHQLWASLGGTEEGWQLWYGRRADALARQAGLTWEDASMPLPAFDLADLNGKTWTTASLKGKVTFLIFWASW